MNNNVNTDYKNKILTIPNVLSFVRLALIPLMMWLYLAKEDYRLTLIVLIISGVTDLVDGFIARRFNMVSDFGKIIDPIADKLTQISMLFCLVFRYTYIIMPLSVLVLKELFAGITGLITVKKTGNVMSSDWHGKVTTALLYLTMGVHIIWFDIPLAVSNLLIFFCTDMMIISAVLYALRNIKAINLQGGNEKCKQ